MQRQLLQTRDGVACSPEMGHGHSVVLRHMDGAEAVCAEGTGQ